MRILSKSCYKRTKNINKWKDNKLVLNKKLINNTIEDKITLCLKKAINDNQRFWLKLLKDQIKKRKSLTLKQLQVFRDIKGELNVR